MTAPVSLLGRRVTGMEDLTRAWATDVRTRLVTLEDGVRVVLQEGRPTRGGRAGIARRIRLGRRLRSSAPGLPIPEVLGGDPGAAVPFLVTRYVAGTAGNDRLADAEGASELGRLAGEAAATVAAVPGRGLRCSRRWADAGLLARAAAGWLREARPHLSSVEHVEIAAVVRRVPGLVGSTPPVLAHGDLAPVNLVIEGGRLAALLDLERMRLAPPLFDAAWFRLMIRHHHPERWREAGPAFLTATGVGEDSGTGAILDDLAVLACLERLAELPSRSPNRGTWARRAASIPLSARSLP